MKQLTLNGEEITDKPLLHDMLAQQLELPEWYGRNLDALADCLSDIREETLIRIDSYNAMKENLGRYASAFKKVLINTSCENANIKVIINR